ncbi:MAG: hypothetical protein IT328_09610 [Caldilineaceae bacterium]|nr:hypothetical protein [Caldilineaceae bacterium]
MAVTWEEAPSTVIELAERIIERYHEHLLDARIAFIMRSEAQSANGKLTLGKAKKLSAEMQVHIPFDFVIWLAKDYWEAFLTPKQREALIDHELSHCKWDGFTASMKGHDVEEFSHIIERYGFWWPQSDEFATAVQAALPLVSTRKEGGVGTIDFGRIAKDAAREMQEAGLDVEFNPAGARGV